MNTKSKPRGRSEPWKPGVPLVKAANDNSFAVPPRHPAVMPVEVVDPYGDGNVLVVCARSDHLGWLHSHRQIDDHQYEAGRLYQRDVEVSEQGLRAIDPTREKVDGGLPPEPLSETRQDAWKRRREAETAMGLVLAPLAHNILVNGMSYGQIALQDTGEYYGSSFSGGPLYQHYDDILETDDQRANRVAKERFGRRHVNNYGVLFRSALNCLVIYYGMATRTQN